MNTTPTTSDSAPTTYTIMGDGAFDPVGRHGLSLSLVVLNRGASLYRQEVLEGFQQLGFSEILSVEEPDPRLDAEGLLRSCPGLRFLLTHQACSPGERINLALAEARGDLVLVLWSDQSLPETALYPKVSKVLQDQARLCWVPELRTRQGEDLPTVMVPTLHKRDLKVLALADGDTEQPASLFPFDYTGIYHRQTFLHSGGYDFRITKPWWQKLDFGLRAHLWGEKISQLKGFKVSYVSDFQPEDTTPDAGYRRFFLKNLWPTFVGDSSRLPVQLFWGFWRRSGLTLGAAWREFQAIRAWVLENRYRFKWDARGIMELWGSPK